MAGKMETCDPRPAVPGLPLNTEEGARVKAPCNLRADVTVGPAPAAAVLAVCFQSQLSHFSKPQFFLEQHQLTWPLADIELGLWEYYRLFSKICIKLQI